MGIKVGITIFHILFLYGLSFFPHMATTLLLQEEWWSGLFFVFFGVKSFSGFEDEETLEDLIALIENSI